EPGRPPPPGPGAAPRERASRPGHRHGGPLHPGRRGDGRQERLGGVAGGPLAKGLLERPGQWLEEMDAVGGGGWRRGGRARARRALGLLKEIDEEPGAPNTHHLDARGFDRQETLVLPLVAAYLEDEVGLG